MLLRTKCHTKIAITIPACLGPDLDSRLAYPRPRPKLAYPRPRPRLSSFKTKTKTKTCLSKTKTETETQDLQDQYWKSMTGMNCDKQKVMASRKSSIPVVAHSKQKKNHTMFNNSSISAVTVTHCSVSNFGSYTQRFKSTMFDRQLQR